MSVRFPNTKHGDSFIVWTHTMIPAVTRWWGTGLGDHAMIGWTPTTVIDTRPRGGVQERKFEDILDSRHSWVQLRLDPVLALGIREDQSRHADEWLLRQLGKGYDFSALAGFPIHRDTEDPGRWYCTELGQGYYAHKGIHVVMMTPSWAITPQLYLASRVWQVVDMEWQLPLVPNPWAKLPHFKVHRAA